MKKLDDQKWLEKNFKKLIAKYGGEYVLIANHKVFPVNESNISKIEKELKEKYKTSPIGMPIPRKEDLLSILKCKG